MDSYIRTGGIGWIGIVCFLTLSEDITLIVASQSMSEEGMIIFSIIVASLIVGTEEWGYSESESDSIMAPNAQIDSFLISFAFSASGKSEQFLEMCSTLILRQLKHPLLRLK